MQDGVERQREAFERAGYGGDPSRWAYHDTEDPLTRYVRDRRVRLAIKTLTRLTGATPNQLTALVVCGGVGGEGTLLANLGFEAVTVSDFSESALAVCRRRDARLEAALLNAEQINLPDQYYSVVRVQDGLHHLPRPALGYTEMPRVAKVAAIVIEPHRSLVGHWFGTEWEKQDQAINYVFRWDHEVFKQLTYSYLLQAVETIHTIRLWDHCLVMDRVGRVFGGGSFGTRVVRAAYWLLNAFGWWLGNMFIGIAIRPSQTDSQEDGDQLAAR